MLGAKVDLVSDAVLHSWQYRFVTVEVLALALEGLLRRQCIGLVLESKA